MLTTGLARKAARLFRDCVACLWTTACLDRCAKDPVSQAQQADIIRLLLLASGRRRKVVHFGCDEVNGDQLKFARQQDRPQNRNAECRSAGNPEQAHAANRQPLRLPVPTRPVAAPGRESRRWYRVRREAAIESVRLHDLHYAVASHAAMNGVPLPVAARMLEHSNVRMTMRYAHVGNREIEAAVEQV